MFLRTIGDDEATGEVAAIYAKQQASLGFVMAAARCFTSRPDLLPLYTRFSDEIRAGFSLGLRDWRLITLIAARKLRSTYCSYVYAGQLVEDLGSREKVLAVYRDFRNAGLDDRDVAMLAYAEKVVTAAHEISAGDIASLRDAGFNDREITDIALCAAFRCFFSTFIDAVGAGPEATFIDEEEAFRETLTVGRAPQR